MFMKVIIDILLWFIGLFTPKMSVRLGHFLAILLENIFRFKRKDVEMNLNIAFGDKLSSDELLHLRHKVYRHFGLLMIEILRLPARSKENIGANTVLHNREILDDLLKDGKGVFFLSAHIGNWESGGIAFAHHGIKTFPIVKELKSGLGDYFVQQFRQKKGVDTIPRKNALKKIMSVLKAQKSNIFFVLDQNMTSDEGVFIDFFGKKACTMSGLAILSQRLKIPVVPLALYRDDDELTHHIEFRNPVEWENISDNRNENIIHNTQRYSNIIESIICEHPSQWIWMHKRWKTQEEK